MDEGNPAKGKDEVGGATWPMAVPRPPAAPVGPAVDEVAPTLALGSGSPRASAEDLAFQDYQDLATIDPSRYLLGREIARGGMGRIVAARDRRLGRPVAIKELLDSAADLRARFEREARITAKLQHPSIVNLLEAGAWPDGEPFYVMKLVAGQSLDAAIKERPTLEARLGLLPHIIAAVDALAYAHSLHIIHRDLKPANVLVGEFGETVVIDWGLAKDLSDPSGTPEITLRPHGALPGAIAETLAGSVLGTPSYMPPEQAMADAVDERADVYALGAMLYHVLAGGLPYLGKTAAEVLHLVVTGPPPPLASRAAGIPPELVTITAKAMAHAAADRYPTAKQLADDLKKFQTGHLVSAHDYSAWQLVRRWIRRHRTPVAVAAVAGLLLVGLGAVSLERILGEQARTEQQRALAEHSRGDAEELTSFMLGDLRDKLAPLGRLDLLDDVAKKAVAYYDGREGSLTDAELGKLARARRNLGDVLRRQKEGDLAGALRQYRASLAISAQRAAAAPDDAERQREVADAHEKIADVVALQGDAAGSLGELRAAAAIRAAIAARDPANAAWQAELGSSHAKVAIAVFAQGDYAAALAENRAAVAIATALVAQDPNSVERQRELGFAQTGVGNVLIKQRDPAGALVAYRAALAIAQALAAREPANAERLHALSVGLNKVGNVLRAQGDLPGALVEYRADLEISEHLAAQDPTNADNQADVSVTRNKIGNVLLETKDTAGALAQYRASLQITEALAAKDPTNADRQRAVSVGRNKAGDTLVVAGDLPGAIEEYFAARAIIETLAAKDPTNAELQVDVAVSHQRVGVALEADGKKAAALEEFRAGLGVAQRLLSREPNNADAAEVVKEMTDKVNGR